MDTMKTFWHISIAYFLILATGQAQDYHFSQFDANPFYINPALTGERLTDYKGIQLNANYRDQMAQYTISPGSFRSAAVSLDEPLNSKFALGQSVFNDQSSSGAFNTFGLILAGAHKLIDQTADNEGNHNLSVGIQVGMLNKTIRPVNFTYDAQYSGTSTDGFDRNLPSGETFARQSFYNFNVNFGIYYRVTSKKKKFSGFGGFSIYNITKPNEAFLEGGGYSALPLRFNLHSGLICRPTKQLSVVPQVLYMNQAQATELSVNTLLYYKIEGSMYETIYGLGIRKKDALIFHLGLRCKGLVFRASYDVPTSELKNYRNQGLELSLVCTFRKKERAKAPENNIPSDTTAQPQPQPTAP